MSLTYLAQNKLALFRIAKRLAFVAGELDAVMPFAQLCNSAAGEFYNDV